MAQDEGTTVDPEGSVYLNKRLGQLENQHPDSWKVEELKSSALSLSRESDDIRCDEATAALSELLRK